MNDQDEQLEKVPNWNASKEDRCSIIMNFEMGWTTARYFAVLLAASVHRIQLDPHGPRQSHSETLGIVGNAKSTGESANYNKKDSCTCFHGVYIENRQITWHRQFVTDSSACKSM